MQAHTQTNSPGVSMRFKAYSSPLLSVYLILAEFSLMVMPRSRSGTAQVCVQSKSARGSFPHDHVCPCGVQNLCSGEQGLPAPKTALEECDASHQVRQHKAPIHSPISLLSMNCSCIQQSGIWHFMRPPG